MTKTHSTSSVAETPPYPFIRTKLHIPGRRAESVARTRLLTLLDERSTGRLILVHAPAGFGKTTLVVEWLHHTETPAAWYALDERDNDFTRFLLYLIAAIQTQIPHFGQDLCAGLLQPPPPSNQLAMDALLSELAIVPQDFVLVLDDYHLILSDEIHHHIAALIDYLPPQVRLIITSRVAPKLPLAKWRARGQLVEVTASDLRFDRRESQAFLRATMALALSDQAIAELEERTEGWAAGLQLAALSLRGATDQRAAIHSFTGSDRHVADYLISEVMARQPASIQYFLERTAILEQFNSSLCDYLLEIDDSHHWLETIDRENIFLVALDNRREWYRYHHLFGELLRTRLAQTMGDEGMARLHRRAAAWYAQEGQTDDAIRHALAGDDAATAAHLVASTPLEVLWLPGGLVTVRRWVENLPDAMFVKYPRAALIGAIASMLVGDIPATSRYAAMLEDTPELEAEHKLIQAIFARNEGNVERAFALLHDARQTLGSDQWLPKTIAQLQIAIAHLEMGNLEQAALLLQEMRAVLNSDSPAGLTMMLQTASFQCMLAAMQGDLDGAKQRGREAVAIAQASPHIVPIVGQIHTTLAGIAYIQNELDEAKEELQKALYWGERTGITDILFSAYETQVKLHCARGEREEALASIQRTRILYEKTNFPDIIQIGRAEEAAVHLRLGNLAQAMRWVTEAGHALTDPIPPRSRSIYYTLADIQLTAARTSGDDSQLDELLALTERLTMHAAERGQTLPQIAALLLQAQALGLQGKSLAAKARLMQALDLAKPGKPIRIFLDSGPHLLELLRLVAVEQPSNAFVAAILEASEQSERYHHSLINPLTDRELEILTLIAAGLSNKKIEERLVVSHNTVRTHIKNLYSKLAVSSRTQAIHKGQELGLL